MSLSIQKFRSFKVWEFQIFKISNVQNVRTRLFQNIRCLRFRDFQNSYYPKNDYVSSWFIRIIWCIPSQVISSTSWNTIISPKIRLITFWGISINKGEQLFNRKRQRRIWICEQITEIPPMNQSHLSDPSIGKTVHKHVARMCPLSVSPWYNCWTLG